MQAATLCYSLVWCGVVRVTCGCMFCLPGGLRVQGMSLPVVRMVRGALNMTLVARSVDEYLHRYRCRGRCRCRYDVGSMAARL